MSASTHERAIGFTQFLIIIGIAVVFFFAWDLGRRVYETMELVQADALAELQLRVESETNTQLKDLSKKVTTDSWLERFVRSYWHWTRDNETIFVPAATPVPVPTPALQPVAPPPASRAFWEEWLDALFGPAQ